MNETQRRRSNRPDASTEAADRSHDDVGQVSRRRFMKASAVAGAGALALGSTTPAAGQSLVDEECTEDEVWQVAEFFETYNNQWGNPDAEQCLTRYDDDSYGWRFDGGDCSGGDPDWCINYPEVYCGQRPWGSDTGVPEFQGLTRGDVDELWMEWDAEIDVDGQYNLTEEWWLLNGSPGGNADITHEIMLVCDWGGGHGDAHAPYREEAVWTDQFDNTIDYWNKTTGGTGDEFHIFALSEPQSTGKVDLKPILDYLTEEENIPLDKQVTGIEFGTETFDGPTGSIRFNQFDVVINGSRYESGPGRDGSAPTPPQSVSATADDTSIDVSWPSVDDADEYNVYLDGDDHRETTSGTEASIGGLSTDTQYEVGVSAENDYGESSQTTTTVTTDGAVHPCEEAGADMETLSNEQTVCDVDGDGEYMDVNGDAAVSNGDVTDFFSNQHVDPWDSRTDLFDFDGDSDVGQGDVVALFNTVN